MRRINYSLHCIMGIIRLFYGVAAFVAKETIMNVITKSHMVKMAKILLTVTMLFAISAATIPAIAKTPLERFLASSDNYLPNTIDYEDFYDAAINEGMVEIESILAENEVPVLGEGDGRYLRRKDLLTLCGKDCSYHDGWGIFLSQFSVQKHRK